MQLKVKRLNKQAKLPEKAHETDAGYDITATSSVQHHRYIEYSTGLSIALPPGTVGLLFPRSSVTNRDLMLKNCVGVIDESYRGEIKFRFTPVANNLGQEYYTAGERIGQLVILELPKIQVTEVEDLDETARGTGGYGSTGTTEIKKK